MTHFRPILRLVLVALFMTGSLAAQSIHMTLTPSKATPGGLEVEADAPCTMTVSLGKGVRRIQVLMSAATPNGRLDPARMVALFRVDTKDASSVDRRFLVPAGFEDVPVAVQVLGYTEDGRTVSSRPYLVRIEKESKPSEPTGSQPSTPTLMFDVTRFYLPNNQTTDVADQLARLQLKEALTTCLNSSGDSVTIGLEGEISVGVGVNIGGRAGYEASVERTDDGYELSLGRSVAATAGVELKEGIEANMSLSTTQTDVYSFQSLDATVDGMRALAICQALGPAADLFALVNSKDLKKVIDEIEGLGKKLIALTKKIDIERGLITTIKKAVKGLKDALQKVRREIKKVEKKISKIPFVGGALKKLLRALFKKNGILDKALSHAERDLTKLVENVAEFTRQAGAFASRTLRLKEIGQALKDAAYFVADLIGYLGDQRRLLIDHYAALSFRMDLGAEVEASVGPEDLIPGLELENGGGLGANVGGSLYFTVRYEFPQGTEPARIVVVRGFVGRAGVEAKLVAGIEFAAESQILLTDTFTKEHGVMALESATATYELDLAAKVSAGLGVAFVYGVGRSMSVTVNQTDLINAGQEAIGALLSGDLRSVTTAVGTIPALFTLQDRYEAGAVAGVGFSIVGTGFSLSGSALWTDQGEEQEARVTMAGALEAMLTDMADRLVGQAQ